MALRAKTLWWSLYKKSILEFHVGLEQQENGTVAFGEASDLNVNTEHYFPCKRDNPSLDVHTVRCITVCSFSVGALFFIVILFF